jgi:hypothetical protein
MRLLRYVAILCLVLTGLTGLAQTHHSSLSVSLQPVDTTKALDPVLSYSTYIGSPTDYSEPYLAANGAGVTCLVKGYTVTGISSTGSQLFSSPFGNATNTHFYAVTVDASGNCYTAGAGSVNTTAGAFQGTPKQTSNPSQFVAKFNARGAVVFATYLAGSGTDTPSGIGFDNSGNVYITGKTTSNDFPTMNPYQAAFGGGVDDSFIAALNSSGSALIYSTYLGGNGTDEAGGIAVDQAQNAYVFGSTTSTNFPLVAAFQSTASVGFVTKVNASGTPVYSTYYPGTVAGGISLGGGIAVDGLGDAYITGQAATGLPLVNPIQTSGEFFVSKFNPSGSALLYSTYFDGGGGLITLDSNDQAYLLNLFPPSTIQLVNPIQTVGAAYLSVLNAAGSAVLFSTYLGGPFPTTEKVPDTYGGLSVDSTGNIYVAGTSEGPVPILNPANGTYSPIQSCGICYPVQSFALKISPASGPVLAFPTNVDFLSWPVGSPSQDALILLANPSSSGTINISNIAITGDYSAVSDNCIGTLAAAASCIIDVIFTPTAAGSRSGTITITDDAPTPTYSHTISLKGIGLAGQASVSPTTVTFPSQAVGTTGAAQIVTLSNTGGASFSISNVSVTGDFAETNNCGVSLGASISCQISVTFTPTTTGTRTGTLSISDSASGSPQTVSVTGTGGNATLGLTVTYPSSSLETVAAGKAARYYLAIGGTGVSGTANLSCSGAPTGATCSVPSTVSLVANATTPFAVEVNTAARSSATLRPSCTAPWLVLWGITIMGAVFTAASKRTRPLLWASGMAILLLVAICSCGGGDPNSNSGSTPAGTYTLVVTATFGNTSQSTNLTLVVQ